MVAPENPDTRRADIDDFVSRLTPEEVMLVVLKRQLYGGKWEPMMSDLENRLNGKPYVFKLETRIIDDLKRVSRLREFEIVYSIDLADFVRFNI